MMLPRGMFYAAVLAALASIAAPNTAFSAMIINNDGVPGPGTGDPPSNRSLGGAGSGQTFTPGDADVTDTLDALDLISVTFFRGHLTGAGNSIYSATTYLAIYDGNPDTSTLVGSSSTSINTTTGPANTTEGTPLVWDFDNLTLDADTEYWAVLSSSANDNNSTTIVQFSLHTLDESVQNYTGGMAVIGNRNPHNTGQRDLRFIAEFAEIVEIPEPSAVFLLASIATSFAAIGKRRRW